MKITLGQRIEICMVGLAMAYICLMIVICFGRSMEKQEEAVRLHKNYKTVKWTPSYPADSIDVYKVPNIPEGLSNSELIDWFLLREKTIIHEYKTIKLIEDRKKEEQRKYDELTKYYDSFGYDLLYCSKMIALIIFASIGIIILACSIAFPFIETPNKV